MVAPSRTCSSCDTPLPDDAGFCPACGAATPTDLNVAFGQGFEDRLRAALADRYRIDRELGQAGMAVVFLAHDLKHDRHVALKVTRPELAASIGPDRFLRKIQIAAKLSHPHILGVYDSGEVDGFTAGPRRQEHPVEDRGAVACLVRRSGSRELTSSGLAVI